MTHGAVEARLADVNGVPFVGFGPFRHEDDALAWASALTLAVEIPHDTRAEAGRVDPEASPVDLFVGPFDTEALARSWLERARVALGATTASGRSRYRASRYTPPPSTDIR